jgi:hypothetical protein
MRLVIDGVNPFLRQGTKLSLGNLGIVLWQGTNDSAFTDEPRQAHIDDIDVYKLKILKKGDAAILIKIVFALAADFSPHGRQTPTIFPMQCRHL